jgi:hypothetical protein
MRPSLLTRLSWLLQDIWELSPLARLRRRVHTQRNTRGTKVAAAALLAALLVFAGFVAARTVARAPDVASPQSPRVVTVQRRVLGRVGDRPGTRLRLRTVHAHGRTVYAHGRTVTQTPVLGTVHAVRVVTTSVDGTNGEVRTVVTTARDTATETSVRLVTVTHPVTVVTTTTVLSIHTVSVPVTVTVTVP